MEKVVVDTDVVIDFLRINSGLFLELLELQKKRELELYLSSITLMELFAGEMETSESTELAKLLVNLKIVSFDQELAEYTGKIKRGKRLQVHFADFIIGATSLYLDAKLATRNRSHFKEIGKIRFY